MAAILDGKTLRGAGASQKGPKGERMIGLRLSSTRPKKITPLHPCNGLTSRKQSPRIKTVRLQESDQDILKLRNHWKSQTFQ